MDQSQNDELNALEDVQSLFALNSVKVATVPALLTGRTQLNGFITILQTNRDIQNVDTKGIAANKQALAAKVIKEILDHRCAGFISNPACLPI